MHDGYGISTKPSSNNDKKYIVRFFPVVCCEMSLGHIHYTMSLSMMISLLVKSVQLSTMENHCGSYSVTLCIQSINVKLKDITT